MTAPSSDFEVSAEKALLPDGREGVAVKVASPQIEINVWLTLEEAAALHDAPPEPSVAEALRRGTSVGKPVHWSRDAQNRYFLLVGDDDETWDIGVTFGAATYADIASAALRCCR